MIFLRRAAFLLLLGLSCPAPASFVLRYELRLGPTERYTALVILADHFGRNFGHRDDLAQLLAGAYHYPGTAFLERYLPVPYEWYVGQVDDHPEIYGDDRRSIVAELRRYHGGDADTSAIVITEHNRIRHPLALLRVGTADAQGLTASMRQFIGRGFDPALLPTITPQIITRDIASFRSAPNRPTFFDVTRPSLVVPHRWIEGERKELKNFALDRATRLKFLRYLYLIGWAHKMFDWGSQPLPPGTLTLPDGSALSDAERLRTGRRASELWVANYGDLLAGTYQSFGFTPWGRIPKELLGWRQDSHYLTATPAAFHAAMTRIAARTQPRGRTWLVHDPVPVCMDDVAGN